jgi:hypothetical protein
MIIRRETLAAVLPAATSDNSRYYLSAVCLEPDGRAIATDGRVLLLATDRSPYPDADFPTIAGAPFHGTPETQTLVDAAIVKSLLSAMPKKATIPILAAVQVSTNGAPTTATIVATDLSAPRVATVDSDGRSFPRYAAVMPSAEQPTTLCLSVEVLETLIKSAKAVTRGKGTPAITFRIPANGEKAGAVVNAVHITIEGDDVDVVGAAMPCRL